MGKTVGIIDFAHSGTTMLAGVCEILGVPMVFGNHKPMKWEDQDIYWILGDDEKLAELVQRRNAQYSAWGFKRPGGWHWMETMHKCLRDPVYLAIFKEPVSVTRRRFGAVTVSKVLNTIEQMRKAAQGMKDCGQPVHMLSYYQATVNPFAFVTTVAKLIGVRPTPGQLDAAIAFIQPNESMARREYPKVDQWI